MDDTLTVGGATTIGSDSGTAVTEPAGQTPATGDAVPENNGSEGGESQGSAEGGQQESGGRRKWSMQDEVRELRAQRRELREQLKSSDDIREELRQVREELNRRVQPQTAKTPANFWADPEARLQALRDELKEVVAEQNNSLMQAFHQTREQEYAQQAQKQEQASAAEFIRSQQGYDPSDDEDLVEIIKEIPNGQSLPPAWKAEYAWNKLQQMRGIGDRSLQKRQAAGVQGQPPGVGFGRKTWNQKEFDQAVDMVEQKMRGNPNDPKMTELFNELMAAHKEGRVK